MRVQAARDDACAATGLLCVVRCMLAELMPLDDMLELLVHVAIEIRKFRPPMM